MKSGIKAAVFVISPLDYVINLTLKGLVCD